ncbi:immunity protein Imm33 domain-containing protein, partial [Priestia aryabhattai]
SKKHGVYLVNTICNYDPDIIPFLDAEPGTAYIRDEKGNFVLDEE